MIVSSASFSAVAEAQNVLKELRERANRAVQESKRLQQEAGLLDSRAERLVIEAHTAAGECVALSEECNRQETILAQLPERLAKATEKAESILKTWGSVDGSISQLYETQAQVAQAKQARIELIRRNKMETEIRLEALEALLSDNITELGLEMEQTMKNKLALEFRLADARTSFNAVSKSLEESHVVLGEIRRTEEGASTRLASARQNAEVQGVTNVDSYDLQLLKLASEQLQIQIQEGLRARTADKEKLALALEEKKSVITAHQIHVENLSKDILVRKGQLLEQRSLQQREQEKLEDQLFGITKEREILRQQEVADKQAVDKLAADLTAEWNKRIENEVQSINEEQARLRQQIHSQLQDNKKEEEVWKACILAKKDDMQKLMVAAKAEREALHRRQQGSVAAEAVPLSQLSEAVGSGVTNSRLPESKSRSKKSKARVGISEKTEPGQPMADQEVVPEMAPAATAMARSKSVVAKLFETATGFISGKANKATTDSTPKATLVSEGSARVDATLSETTTPASTVWNKPRIAPRKDARTDGTSEIRDGTPPRSNKVHGQNVQSSIQLTPVSFGEGKKGAAERIKTPDWVHSHGHSNEAPPSPLHELLQRGGTSTSNAPQPRDVKREARTGGGKVAEGSASFMTPAAAVSYSHKYSQQPVMTYSRTKTTAPMLRIEEEPSVHARPLLTASKASGAYGKKSHQNQKRDKQKPIKKSHEDEDQSSASQFDLFE